MNHQPRFDELGYSPKDLMDKIIAIAINQEVMIEDIKEIKAQTQRTNGRVNKLERKAENEANREAWQKEWILEHPTVQNIKAENVTVQRRWYDNKDLVKAAGILAAAAGAIVTFVTAAGGFKQ